MSDGDGADFVFGNMGGDHLHGGAGDNTLYGSRELAQFHFADGSGRDVIVDGPLFSERLHIARDINGAGVTTTADLLARLSHNDAGQMVLDLGGGYSVAFIDCNACWFVSSDFVIFLRCHMASPPRL